MKRCLAEIARWAAIVVCGGYGTWQLAVGGYYALRKCDDWAAMFFLIAVSAIIAAPCIAVAYLCFRRQYRKLFLVVGVVGMVVLYFGLLALPGSLGIDRYLRDNLDNVEQMHARPWLDLAFGVYCIGSLAVAILAAAWFYRFCHGLAYRGLDGSPRKTRATRWLIWLGILCMIVPTWIGVFSTFSGALDSPPPAVSSTKIADWFVWTQLFFMLGIILIFLGLIRRQPVLDSQSGDGPTAAS
jgi:hypothetical protein